METETNSNQATASVVRLHVWLFGGFRVTTEGDTPLVFSQRKLMALLAYLALQPDRMHSRDNLIGLLWPDMPEDKARVSLRVALNTLRKTLQVTGLVDDLLQTTRTSVAWGQHEQVAVDVLQFGSHVQRGALPQALTLYRGSLLDGLYLDDCPAFDE